jgi:gluconolactonase
MPFRAATVRERLASVAILSLIAATAAGQNFSDIKVEKVASGMRFTEGPAWSLDGFLLFSDCVNDKLYKFIGGKGVTEFGDRPGGPNGNAYDVQGRLYTCEFRQRRVTRTSKNGKVEILASQFDGKRLNAPNDIVVRRDGHVYFTDPAFGNQEDTRELDFYGVFHITPKGEMEPLVKLKTRPNGVTLSPNGRILYIADSDARCVRAYDVDKAGAASAGRVFADKIPGVPDGLRTDEKGNLYVAAKFIYVYSPQAQLLGQIDLPETPSNIAFGDADFESLFITARTNVYRIRIGVKGALQNYEKP